MVVKFNQVLIGALKNGIKIKDVFSIVKDFKKSKTSKTSDFNGLLQYDLSIW